MNIFKSDEDRAREAAEREFGELLRQLDPHDLTKTTEVVRRLREKHDVLESNELLDDRLAAFSSYAETALQDDIVSFDEDNLLHDLRNVLGLGYELLSDAGLWTVVDRIEIGRINAGRLYTVESDLFVAEGEHVVFEEPASLFKPRRRLIGRSSGFSFRIAPGVRFHTGWFETAEAVDRKLVEDDHGLFSVTTKRIVFRGAGRTIEIDFNKIVGMDLFSDAIRFHLSNRERVDTFQMQSAPVAAATINFVATGDPVTLSERLSGPFM